MIIDAIAIPALTRSSAEDMHAGGLTAVNVICSLWEDLAATAANIACLKAFVRANSDLLLQVYGTADIHLAAASRRTGIIVGWQNTSALADDASIVGLFHELGLRIAQLTFNAANAAATGCYEQVDGGLTEYGRELVGEFNAWGIALDLSHLGLRSAQDVLEASVQPVIYTHTSPAALSPHPRNRTDGEMRRVVDGGGIVSFAALPHYLHPDGSATVADYARALEYAVNALGEDGVALGTDMTPGQGDAFYDFISRAGGTGRPMMAYGGRPPRLAGMSDFRDYPALRDLLARRGMSPGAIDKLFGGNLLGYFARVWKPAPELACHTGRQSGEL